MEAPPPWTESLVRTHGEPARQVIERLAAALDGVPDPGRGWMDLRALSMIDADAVPRLAAHPEAVELLARLGAHSRWAAGVVHADPGRFWELLAGGSGRAPLGRRAIDADLAGIDALDPRAARTALARCRDRHLLRIIAGDVGGRLAFEQVVAELSSLADALVEAALGIALARWRPAFIGDPGRFTVLAFGKMGGRELNYSSDIDLVFVYDPPADPAPDADVHQFWIRVGTELIRILERPADGVMFRVDMRLRPEGDRGELCLSLRETLDYYWSVGRPWERQALIKARPCAGDPGLGRRIMAELAAWVYPAEPRWEELEESRSMRRRIEERALEANVKTAAGGIRDIEFLVQYFQLLYGGRDPELRRGDTLPCLRLLRDRGILPRADCADLEQAYLFLRTIEHRLQMWEDRQVHEVPADAGERRSLAWRSGVRGADPVAAFDARLRDTRARVRALAERHFLEQGGDAEAWLQLVVQGDAAPERAAALLRPAGFRDPAAAVGRLRELAREPFFLLTRDRTERALVALAPLLLAAIGRSPDPDRTLANLVRVTAAVGGRATFFETLARNPEQFALVVDLCGWCGFLVDLLAETPGLADELAEALAQPAPRLATLLGQARALVAGLSQPAPALRFLKARELLATALHDLRGAEPDAVAGRLTLVTQAVGETVLLTHLRERARDWGVPVEQGRPTRFAVLAAGKAGGGELGYVSDLDVIFVCDPGGTCPRADRGGDAFWTAVAQDLVRSLDEAGLYEVDARLRPWGDQGAFVTPFDTLVRYWSEERDLWERMAMVRIRPFAGEPQLGAAAARLVRTAAMAAALPPDAADQVRAMRRRLEATVAGQDECKRGPGGYVDIEFLVQFRLLGADPAGMPAVLSTATALDRLAEAGRIPGEARAALLPALRMLRLTESRQRLAAGRSGALPTDGPGRAALARRCGMEPEGFEAALADARRTARDWFDRIVC
jgi:glutamate-ammonia-ligase adenylyltransferase